MSNKRMNIPGRREDMRKPKAFTDSKQIQQARGKLFSAGLHLGIHGRSLLKYVKKQMEHASA